jgi:hypothetical protein
MNAARKCDIDGRKEGREERRGILLSHNEEWCHVV